MTRRVSEKLHNVTSYCEERSLPQVNECAFDSGLIEKNGANTNLDIAGWILSGKSLHFWSTAAPNVSSRAQYGN